MLYDGRRGLEISYNILNLPAKVVERTGATAADGAVKAEYLYSADGIKQRVVDGAGSNGYLYLGTLVLSKSGESYSLASTGFGGGRIIGGAGNSCLAYYYGTDHLGSVRVITDGSGSVVERNDYYSLGMRTATGNNYPQLTANLYKYNGKEVQTVGGLGFTDYGARMYDDFTGRWFVPDPLAEKYAFMSPYMYCGGNPINVIDIDGRDAIYIAFPKYRANGIPFTGHAGVLLIDNKTGLTKYYEYGRYNGSRIGKVRPVTIPNVVIGKDGKPTLKSLNRVLKQLSDISGDHGDIEGAYIISDKFKEMNDYAKNKMKENDDPKRKKYSIINNNCATFAEDVITQDKSVDKPFTIIKSPVNIVSEYQDKGNARVQYKAKTQTTTIEEGDENDAKINFRN